jgi:hypothetical protein
MDCYQVYLEKSQKYLNGNNGDEMEMMEKINKIISINFQ